MPDPTPSWPPRTDGHEGGRAPFLRPQDLRSSLHPRDYERRLLGGSQANVALYVDASYFLMYRQVFQGAGDDDRPHGRDGRVPAPDRPRCRHSAGHGRDAARDLPGGKPLQSLPGLRVVRHAGHHHRHHPADDAHRHRHDRRHLARIRSLPQAVSSGAPPHVHAAHRGGQGRWSTPRSTPSRRSIFSTCITGCSASR